MTEDKLILDLYDLVKHYVYAPIEDVFGPDALRTKQYGRRKRDVVTCRSIITRLLRLIDKEKYTLKRIGLEFGGRDHSTISSGLKQLNNHIEKELKTREIVYKLELYVAENYETNTKILNWEKRTDEFGNLLLQRQGSEQGTGNKPVLA